MNFLDNLPGGRAGEANRSDPQSGVSRLMERSVHVNVPVPVLVPVKAVRLLILVGLACAGSCPRRARAELAPQTPAYHPTAPKRGLGSGTGTREDRARHP